MTDFFKPCDQPLFLTIALLILPTLACVASGSGYYTPPLAQEAYFTCVTATPVPTEIFYDYGTPDPIVTPLATTIPITGFTTPVPTQTPYYRVEQFYLHQLVHLDGLVLSLQTFSQAPHPEDPTLTEYSFTFQVSNQIGDGQLLPLSNLLFIRRVIKEDGTIANGRWSPNPETVAQLENTPLSKGESRRYSLTITAPTGDLNEVGLVTGWDSTLEGGVPIWFLLESDPIPCPYGYADWGEFGAPPPPTPAIVGYGGFGSGYEGGLGICGWPAEGSFVRGYGCSVFQGGLTNNRGCFGVAPYFHNGLDIGNVEGTPIKSPVNGFAFAGVHALKGNFVTIINGEETHELLHLTHTFVGNGQPINAGDVVGEMGCTGNCTGSHLHWTLKINGVDQDPLQWTGCGVGEVAE